MPGKECEGTFYTVPDADYRKAPGVSNSMLKHIAPNGENPGSPAHFKRALSEPSPDTDAMFFGRMVHSRILTPDCALPQVELIPETYPAPENCDAVKKKKCQPGDPLPWHGASKFCKDWLAEREAKGIRPVTKQEMDNMDGVVNAVTKHPVAMMALKEGRPEVSLFKRHWITEDRSILCKARLDWVPKAPTLVDIKTCMDARKDAFSKEMWKRRYYVQFAYYLDLWNALNPQEPKEHFAVIAVEKFAPFAVSIFNVDPKALQAGRGEYRDNLALLSTCMELDDWPAYSPDPQTIDLPAYAYKKGGLEIYA